MSYILDALKKSDQERQQSNGPTIQTVQHSRVGIGSGSAISWPLAIIIILLIALLAGAGWYIVNSANKVEAIKPPVDQASNVKAIAIAESTKTGIPKAPISDSIEKTETAPKPVAIKEKPPVLELWELPDNVQQKIPAMTFSFHVYSDNPVRRTIIINKRRVKQGETVAPGLVLEEITAQGIIFDWESDYRFSINVVENW